MTTIKIGIIEEDEIARQRLLNCIHLWAEHSSCDIDYDIAIFTEQLLSDDLLTFDIIFMDIKREGKVNGMELARQLRKEKYMGEIVFLTTHHEYVFEGYQVNALNYLLKPVMLADVEYCLNTLQRKLKGDYYLLQNPQLLVKIPYQNILYFTSAKHYVDIICTDGTYSQLSALKNIIPTLPPQFMQCHRTTAINIEHIHSIKGNNITMSNGHVIPVSKTYFQQIREAFIRSTSP